MSQQNTDIKIFAGNSNPPLASEISNYLAVPLGKATVETFSDGESKVEIKENVRGADVFVLQSTCAPTNDSLMEQNIRAVRTVAVTMPVMMITASAGFANRVLIAS